MRAAETTGVRLRCFFGSTVRVVSVAPDTPYADLVALLAAEFRQPVTSLLFPSPSFV